MLVEERALEIAEEECLADSEFRAKRRQRERLRRQTQDLNYIAQFAKQVRELFPSCPSGREQEIAEHACIKYSGRVGRSALAKRLDSTAIRLAVIAHIRHRETNYDELLASGYDRRDARSEVEGIVDLVLTRWEHRNEIE